MTQRILVVEDCEIGNVVIASELESWIHFGVGLDQSYVEKTPRTWQKFIAREAVHQSTGEALAQREKVVVDALQK